MSNLNAEQLAKMEEKLFRLKQRREKAAPRSPERAKIQSQVEALEAKMKSTFKAGQMPARGYNKGGAVKKFKPCAGCPSPAACSAAGKCAKAGKARGYAKGGYVNCGASVKPTQKGTK